MKFHDQVEHLPTLFLAGQEVAPLHKPQVFGGHVARDAARLGQFADRVSALEKQLHHPKPMGMGQSFEAFRRSRQSVQGRQPGPTDGFRLCSHPRPFHHSDISQPSDLSIRCFTPLNRGFRNITLDEAT